jgi:hypothetical protein
MKFSFLFSLRVCWADDVDQRASQGNLPDLRYSFNSVSFQALNAMLSSGRDQPPDGLD